MSSARLSAPELKALGQARCEEILFFRSVMGWSEPRIAARLGLTWKDYSTFLRRHPELQAKEYTFEIEERVSA